MTQISNLNMFILPFVRDCPAVAAEVAARFAVIEFCEQSQWLRFEVDPITIEAGIAAYEIEVPEGSLPLLVTEATLLDNTSCPLQGKSAEELKQLYGDWRAREGTPRYFTQLNPDEIILVPSPDTRIADGLRMLVGTRPTNDTNEIDDTLFDRWAETLAYGARGRLMDMAGQPYYDPVNSPACWKMFYMGVSKAKAERTRDLTRTVQHVQMRNW